MSAGITVHSSPSVLPQTSPVSQAEWSGGREGTLCMGERQNKERHSITNSIMITNYFCIIFYPLPYLLTQPLLAFSCYLVVKKNYYKEKGMCRADERGRGRRG